MVYYTHTVGLLCAGVLVTTLVRIALVDLNGGGGNKAKHLTTPTAKQRDAYYERTLKIGTNPIKEKHDWAHAAKRIYQDVQHRVGKRDPLQSLCGVGYYWVCNATGSCRPWADWTEDLQEVNGSVRDSNDIKCGPLLRTDHVKGKIANVPLHTVLLRHASEMQYVDNTWEALFNGAAFAHHNKIPQLLSIVTKADYGDLIQFPRNVFYIKVLAIHAAFALHPSVTRLVYIDNDAFFTEEAFSFKWKTGLFSPFLPMNDRWTISMQDEMPYDEPCAGILALQRTEILPDVLSAWWNEAATVETSENMAKNGTEQHPDGCGWYHPYDQRSLNVALLRRMSGANNFTIDIKCTRYSPQLWILKSGRKLAKIPEPILDRIFENEGRIPVYDVKWSWVIDGEIHHGDQLSFFSRAVKKYDNVTMGWDRSGMVKLGFKLPFFSQHAWPGVYFIPWNVAPFKFTHSQFFQTLETLYPPQPSLIHHTGGNNFKCWRHHLPLGINGRTAPPWAEPLYDISYYRVRDVSRQGRCKKPNGRLFRDVGG